MWKQVSLLWKWIAFSNVSDSPLPTQHHSVELQRAQKWINTTHTRPFMPCSWAHPAAAPRRTRGCRYLWALCDPSQELPRGDAQSHSAKSPDFTQHDHGKVCLWNRTLPNCINPQSLLLSPLPRSSRQIASTYSSSGQQAQPQAATCYCPSTTEAVNDWQLRRGITWTECSSPVLPHWKGQSKASTPQTLLWCFSKITHKALETLDLLFIY